MASEESTKLKRLKDAGLIGCLNDTPETCTICHKLKTDCVMQHEIMTIQDLKRQIKMLEAEVTLHKSINDELKHRNDVLINHQKMLDEVIDKLQKKQNPDPRSEAEQQALWEKDQAQLIYEDQHPEINELKKEKWWKRIKKWFI